MFPDSNLPYRAELHSDHVIISPALADFSECTFVYMKGPQGETGAQGATGPQGPQGPTGILSEATTSAIGGAYRASDSEISAGTVTSARIPSPKQLSNTYAKTNHTHSGYASSDHTHSGYATSGLTNLMAHTAIDTTTPVDFIICSNPETNGYVRIWKSGWVEQFFFNKKSSGSSSAWTAFNFYVAFASKAYSLFDSVVELNASAAIAQIWASYKSKSSTGFTAYLSGGSNLRDFYACGQGDTTSINQYISSL